jgi:hypothetical protein
MWFYGKPKITSKLYLNILQMFFAPPKFALGRTVAYADKSCWPRANQEPISS